MKLSLQSPALSSAPSILAGVGILVLVGCAPHRVTLNQTIWSQKSARIGVMVVKYPQGSAYKQGSQGLLDMAINAAMSRRLQTHLRDFKPSGFDTLRDQFVAELIKRGIEGKVVASPLDLAAYNKFSKPTRASGEFFDRDLRGLAAEQSVDLLVLLAADQFGTLQEYYGFVPIGSPQVLFRGSGHLIDLRTNQVMWRIEMKNKDSLTRIDGKWDQPPDFSNLDATMERAIAKAREILFRDFFATSAATIEDPR